MHRNPTEQWRLASIITCDVIIKFKQRIDEISEGYCREWEIHINPRSADVFKQDIKSEL